MAISDSASEDEEGGCEKYLLFLGGVGLEGGEDLRRLEARGVLLGGLEVGLWCLGGVVVGAAAAGLVESGLRGARRGIVVMMEGSGDWRLEWCWVGELSFEWVCREVIGDGGEIGAREVIDRRYALGLAGSGYQLLSDAVFDYLIIIKTLHPDFSYDNAIARGV